MAEIGSLAAGWTNSLSSSFKREERERERESEIHKFSRYPFISLIFLLQISSVPDAGRIGEDAQPEHAEDLPSAAPPQARLRSSQ